MATTNFRVTISEPEVIDDNPGEQEEQEEQSAAVPNTGKFTSTGTATTASSSLFLPIMFGLVIIAIVTMLIASIRRKQMGFGLSSSKRTMMGFFTLIVAALVAGGSFISTVLTDANASADAPANNLEVQSSEELTLEVELGESKSICDEIVIPEATRAGFALWMSASGGLADEDGETFDGIWVYKIESEEVLRGEDDWQDVPSDEVELVSIEEPTEEDFSVTICYGIDATESEKTGDFTTTISYGATAFNPTRRMQSVDEWGDEVETGETVEVVDERDGETYTVARLADGKLWMTKNLRLDLSKATITEDNTNHPTEAFLTAAEANPEATNGSWCSSTGTECADQILFDTSNIGITTVGQDGNTYDDYGVYYNWYTATAGNGIYNTFDTTVMGDICPAGWRLPVGGETGDFGELFVAMGGPTLNGVARAITTTTTPSVEDMMPIFLASPYNFAKSGIKGNYKGTEGRYWTSTATPGNDISGYGASIKDTVIYPGTGAYVKYSGNTIRCVEDINSPE